MLAVARRADASTSMTVCPRARSARATRPSPAPKSTVRRPGGGRSSKNRSPWKRKNESSTKLRVQAIQFSACSSHAPRNDMAPILLRPDPPREADVVDLAEDDFHRLADGDRRGIDLVDVAIRSSDQVARVTD